MAGTPSADDAGRTQKSALDLRTLGRGAQDRLRRLQRDRQNAIEAVERAKSAHEAAIAKGSADDEVARAEMIHRNAQVAYYEIHQSLVQTREEADKIRDTIKSKHASRVPRRDDDGAFLSSQDEVLVAEGVSKKFSRSLKTSMRHGVRDVIRLTAGLDIGSDHLRSGEFWAVKDVSLRLRRGESMGVVGHNGSGKTTLARVLAGVYPPDTGRVIHRGRMTSILTIGAGFHQHLSGIENVRLNAAVMGMTEDEIGEIEDSIVEFAGLGDRISKPVGMYSSGMRMRLGFAVVTATKPDMMVFDEVLAVGDLDFRAKCVDRLTELRDTSSLVMVAQSPGMIERFCANCLWLHSGEVRGVGPIEEIGERYVKAMGPDDEVFEDLSGR